MKTSRTLEITMIYLWRSVSVGSRSNDQPPICAGTGWGRFWEPWEGFGLTETERACSVVDCSKTVRQLTENQGPTIYDKQRCCCEEASQQVTKAREK